MTVPAMSAYRLCLIGSMLALVLFGCAKTSTVTLKTYPAYPENHPIEVLIDVPKDREYVEVALIDAKGGEHVFSDRSSAGAVEQLKVAAREAGADAIIVRSTQRGNYNWSQGGFDRSNADAVAIRYLD